MTASRPHPGKVLFVGILIWLALLNAGVWFLREPPMTRRPNSLEVPVRLGSWFGRDIELSHHESAILAPASLLSRGYVKRSGVSAAVTLPLETELRADWAVIWLNVIQTDVMGKLHNFYDSLVASGANPTLLEIRRIETAKGPLRASLIHYYNVQGQPHYMLLWYQWEGGSAPNRWHWYADVLQLRLQRRPVIWQLVEVATPVARPGIDRAQSPELDQIEKFARMLYEQSSYPSPRSGADARHPNRADESPSPAGISD